MIAQIHNVPMIAIVYLCDPHAIPITSAQKMKEISRVSLIIFLNRMIDSAPIKPTATTKLPAIVDITIAITTVIKIRDWTNDLEYDKAL